MEETSHQSNQEDKDTEQLKESVFFVPHTPGGTLRNILTKLEESLKFRTRFKCIEEIGRSVREMVVQKDRDPQACGRLGCVLCRSKPGS